MKNLMLIILLTFGFIGFAQLGIDMITPHEQAILDFPAGQNKGIILPMVSTLPTANANNNGTFVLDLNNGKIRIVENGAWRDLTKGNAAVNVTNFPVNTSDDTGDGVIIGSTSSSASGVLVLESTDKGLMLPKVTNAHTDIKSPYPGLMCYDTTKAAVAIYDGTGWFYWK